MLPVNALRMLTKQAKTTELGRMGPGKTPEAMEKAIDIRGTIGGISLSKEKKVHPLY